MASYTDVLPVEMLASTAAQPATDDRTMIVAKVS
jgi:hypothetical protein